MHISHPKRTSVIQRLAIILIAQLTLMTSGLAVSDIDIATKPLSTSESIPGNLLLVPSVEYPTIISVSNLGDYSSSREYTGYFDPKKCYQYKSSGNESEHHFAPTGAATNHTCSSEWSGNFLNWAATQTIDPFRSALTGGYRVKDTPTETWLEKARSDRNSLYPDRTLSGKSAVSAATPFNNNSIKIQIGGRDNKMRVRAGNQNHDYFVRVKVCDASVGLEPNCKQYSQGWKPEGTIQQYSDSMRYGIFGYLNDHEGLRDGGVLRANQKWVGPKLQDTDEDGDGNPDDNPNKEWDPDTGVLIPNPNPSDASDTNSTISGYGNYTIKNSGIINYLNKFGQMTTKQAKSIDPVSELYYAAIRYFKNQGNVSAYSNMSGNTDNKYKLADGFPVITTWDDPIQHWCQKNVILGIGDIYTHRDKNLPGNTNTNGEPSSQPGEVSSDSTVNVKTATAKVATLEGISSIKNLPFTGRYNSAYIAGLAYHAHTTDIRPDLTEGKTTVTTYWVDVCEAQSLEGMGRNQYALAAKYGGFKAPADYTFGDALEESWWHTNGDTLVPFGDRGKGQTSFKRPDNFFIASEANEMVDSLTKAFANIYVEMAASNSSAAASSAALQSDTLLYIAGYRTSDWSGTLKALEVESDGSRSCNADSDCWDAEDTLRKLGHAKRKIFTRSTATGTGSGSGATFQFANLNDAQKAALNYRGPDDTEDNLGSARVAWLRGNDAANATFRSRTESGESRLLGDIVNSDPYLSDGVLYVGANDGMLHAFESRNGEELFAYIPSSLLLPETGKNHAPLSRLMNKNYADNHRYFMDGKIAVGDASLKYTVDGEAEYEKKHVLVASQGAGGRTVFALNVSGPDAHIEDDPWFHASDVLWEFRHADLGYRIGTPLIVRITNDTDGPRWVAIFGNGYNSDNHKAVLFVVDLTTGTLISTIDTQVGDATTPNGLAGPTATDWPAFNLRTRFVYAGDLQGNLWRFDLSGDVSTWNDASKRQVLFKATDPADDAENDYALRKTQPITTNPRLALYPTDPEKIIVAFGTGSYFREDDANDNQAESLYGIIDVVSSRPAGAGKPAVITREDLLEQTFEDVTDGVISQNSILDDEGLLKFDGWYIDLDVRTGERVISEATFPSGTPHTRIRFTTMIPDTGKDEDICTNEPGGYLYDIDLSSGGRTDKSVLDINRDGEIDDKDRNANGYVSNATAFGKGERALTIQDDDTDLLFPGDGSDPIRGKAEDAGSMRQSWRQLR